MVAKAAQQGEQGGEPVNQTLLAMKDIAQQAHIIEDIACQTNLLALIASIEAAASAEQMRGQGQQLQQMMGVFRLQPAT